MEKMEMVDMRTCLSVPQVSANAMDISETQRLIFSPTGKGRRKDT
jgi:hypothetical protein